MLKLYWMPGDQADETLLRKLRGEGLEVETVFCFGEDIDGIKLAKKIQYGKRIYFPMLETDNEVFVADDLMNDITLNEIIKQIKTD